MAFLVYVTDQCELGDRDNLIGRYETEDEAKAVYEFHQRAYGGAWVVEEEP
jgi:hypothetical protein